MRRFSTMTRAIMAFAFLLGSSCTAITHVDEFEAVQVEIEKCMEQDFNKTVSQECAYCRCTKCDIEIQGCGLRCWEIVFCAIANRCDRGNTSSCVLEKCGPLLDRALAGVDQASALAVCIGGCNDVCLDE